MICLLVMTDGRADLLVSTMDALSRWVDEQPITRRVMHDDSADPTYRQWLRRMFPEFEVIGPADKIGYAGSMRAAWQFLAAHVQEPWVLHMEDDFRFTRDTDLAEVVELLVHRPYLAQVAFRRQPWAAEPDPGGYVAAAPGWYADVDEDGWQWIEHRRGWTCNPNLHRRKLCAPPGWPDGPHSEGRYGLWLTEQGLPWGVPGPDVRFGIWGPSATSEGWVQHTGHVRAGFGY